MLEKKITLTVLKNHKKVFESFRWNICFNAKPHVTHLIATNVYTISFTFLIALKKSMIQLLHCIKCA